MTPAQEMAQHAADGKLALQCCTECGAIQYPPRELCAACLSDRLQWRVTAQQSGELLAVTTLHHSHDAAFREALPLHVGLVQLAPGATAVCFLAAPCQPGAKVSVTARLDAAGRAMLTAAPA